MGKATASFEASCKSSASAAAAWAAFTDPPNWPGDVITAAKIDGDFVLGSIVTIKATGLPKVKLTITQIEPQRLWVGVAKLPGLTLTVEHIIEQIDAGAMLRERGLLNGPLAGAAARLIGNRLKATFAGTTAHCARLAEQRELT